MSSRFQRPSPEAIEWALSVVDGAVTLDRVRRLTGDITSAVHRLDFKDHHGRALPVVLRRWIDDDYGPDYVRSEAATLTGLARSTIPAPRLVAADPDGSQSGGTPALLMSLVSGRTLLTPSDPHDWVRQMAALLPAIHALDIEGPPRRAWFGTWEPEIPPQARRPDIWREAVDISMSKRPTGESAFTHADYQHFNMLWSRQKLVGLVDWTNSVRAPKDTDVGHCRLNLAILFSAELAEEFRLAYEAEAGRCVDPLSDLGQLLCYSQSWKEFIPIQAGRNAQVDIDGMDDRVEELVRLTLNRM